MASRRLQVVLDLDTGRYSGRLNQAASQMKVFSGTVDKSSGSVRTLSRSFDSLNRGMSTPLQKLRDYVLILGNIRLAILNVRDIAVGWVGALVQQSAQVERLTMLMRGLSDATTEAGKTAEAAENMRFLFAEARRSGFAVESLADAFVKMKSGGLDPTNGSLVGLTNAVAKFGGTFDIMHRASIAIQQMSGKGVISMEELRQQLGEAVPTAMADMARAAGMSVKEFTDLVSKGVVQAGPALELLFREWEVLYNGAGERLANTFSGQIGILKTNILDLANAFTGFNPEKGVAESGSLYDQLTKGIKELNAAMQSPAGRAFATDVGTSVAVVARAIGEAAQFIIRFKDEIVALGKAGVAAFLAIKTAGALQWFIQTLSAARVSLIQAAAGATQASGPLQQMFANWASGIQRVSNEQRNSIALANGRLALANREIMVSQQKAMEMNAEVTRLRTLGRDYAQNATIIDRHRRASEAALAAGRASGRFRDFETGTFISQSRAIEINNNLIRAGARNRLAAANNARALRAAEAGLSAAFAAQAAAVSRATVAEAANTMGKRAMAAAATGAAVASRALGVAVNIALGPVGMLATLLISAAYSAGVFESSATRAAAAAARLAQGIADVEAMKDVAARRDKLRRENERLEASLDPGAMRLGMFSEAANQFQTPEQRRERIRKNNAELNKLNDALKQGSRAINLEAGDVGARVLQGERSDFLAADRRRYEQLKSEGATLKELDAAREAFQQKQTLFDNGVLASLDKRRRAAQAAGDAAKVQRIDQLITQYRSANGITDDLAQSTEELRSSLVGAGKGAGAAGKSANQAAREYDSAREKYSQMIAQQKGDIAELTAGLSGAEGALAQFQARLKAGMYSDATANEIKKLEEGYKKIDELNAQSNWARSMRELQREIIQSAEAAQGLWAALEADTTGVALEQYRRVQSARAQFADKLASAQATGDPAKIAEVNAEIDKLVSNLGKIEAVDTMDRWRQMSEEIQASLMSEEEARQFTFEQEMARQQALLDQILQNAQIEADQKILAQQRFENWKRLSEERLRRDTENTTVRMARDWANLGQNIQQSLSGALNSFVDGMFDAQFSFGDFAKNLIKEIVKIIIRAMIAYAILSAIGLANNSAGNPVSFTQFLGGQISSGLGGFGGGAGGAGSQIGFGASGSNLQQPLPGGQMPGVPRDPLGGSVSIAHIGGIIGNLRQTANVDPAVFAKAKTYHTGTNSIGGRALRPGEVPIIGMEGEAVLTKEQQGAVANALKNRTAPQAPPVTINFINNSGQELIAESGEPEFNGKDMIISVVVEAAQRQGPLRDILSNIGN